MSTVHEKIYEYLITVEGITDIVSERISPGDLPQDQTIPAITFRRVSNQRHHARRYVSPRFQVNSWARTPMKAEELAQEVREAFEGFHGSMDGLHVVSIVVNDTDDLNPPSGLYRVMTDVRFTFPEL